MPSEDDLRVIKTIEEDATAYIKQVRAERTTWPPAAHDLLRLHIGEFMNWVVRKHTSGETILPS